MESRERRISRPETEGKQLRKLIIQPSAQTKGNEEAWQALLKASEDPADGRTRAR